MQIVGRVGDEDVEGALGSYGVSLEPFTGDCEEYPMG
jgi:hypothetical protein